MSDVDQWWNDRSIDQKRIIILAILIFSLLFTRYGMGEIQIQMSSKDWPAVEGQIVSSQVTFDGDWEDPMWNAQVCYVYSVNGISYSSRKVAAGSGTYGSDHSAQEVVDRYPQDSTVNVFYDPNSPSTAVLEVGRSSGAFSATLILLIGWFLHSEV